MAPASKEGEDGEAKRLDAVVVFPYHAKTKEECFRQLGITKVDVHQTMGLTTEEAAARLEQYGLNELTAKEKVTIWKRIYDQVANVLVAILAVVAVVSAVQAVRYSAKGDSNAVVTDTIQVVLIVFVVT
jgi:P-type Ca2+ transporter type 2C